MYRDRDGDLYEHEPTRPTHEPRCDGTGWLVGDPDHPRPCLDCRPHLRARMRR